MKRVLALAGACLLIAASVLLRQVLSDDDDGGANASDDGDLVVACIPELAEACRAIDRPISELRVEDPADTIAALDSGERIDAWVTLDPWPAIAETVLRRDALGDVVAVADTELVLLARTSAIPGTCPAVPTWTCLVDALGDDVAVPNPASALGALVLGHAAIDFFGPGLASNDFEVPELQARLDALDTDLADPLDEIRVGLPVPSVTGALLVDLARLGSRLEDFTQSPGATPATAAVVVAGPDADRITGEASFTDRLDELGWRVAADAATTGLPNAGVLFALAQEVST